jgi:hypothetical protein
MYDHNVVSMSNIRHVESINQHRTSANISESVRRSKSSDTIVTSSLRRANCRHKYVLFLFADDVVAAGSANGVKYVKTLDFLVFNYIL